jgi:predicted nucleic acid-binding protein
MKTFLDSGVLLTAWKGKESDAQAAQRVMDDDQRDFVTSQMVKLELLPKPAYFKHSVEEEFYNLHFEQTSAEATLSREIADSAMKLARKHGLAAADALNIASAIHLEAEEFVTAELLGKPLFRVTEIRVVQLHAA